MKRVPSNPPGLEINQGTEAIGNGALLNMALKWVPSDFLISSPDHNHYRSRMLKKKQKRYT
jgi:hypothetical protein